MARPKGWPLTAGSERCTQVSNLEFLERGGLWSSARSASSVVVAKSPVSSTPSLLFLLVPSRTLSPDPGTLLQEFAKPSSSDAVREEQVEVGVREGEDVEEVELGVNEVEEVCYRWPIASMGGKPPP